MGYKDAISYLYGLQKHGIKLGLENPLKLLSLFGNPHDSFKSIHIAGTNGKGSTASMLASMLKHAGFKVGLFTSPHLVSFTERIRINDEEILEEEVVALAEEIKEKAGSINPTFFEVVTVMAFVYFKRKNVDWAVIETGMGGRLDATNVIKPQVSIITSISYDHKEFLGESIEEIAGEKAGIIKEGVPVVTAPQEPPAMDVIIKRAEEMHSKVHMFEKDFSADIKKHEPFKVLFDYSSETLSISEIVVPLSGEYQAVNASLAIRAFELISKRDIESIVKTGLRSLRWQGRLELIAENILIDGAHNPTAARELANTLRTDFLKDGRKLVLIMGVMADKDIKGILSPLLPLADEVIFTAPDYGRAASPEELSNHALSLGFKSKTAKSVKEAIDMTKGSNCLVLITGSFYTIGEAKEALGMSGSLTGLRE
jgi:dihydrofolate synthase/folylpolyglutamate synthase